MNDTTVTYLRKHKTPAQQKQEQLAGTKKSSVGNKTDIMPGQQLAKLEKNAEEGILAVPKVPIQLRIEIQKARMSKGMKQQDLAKKLNLPVETIRGYENGTIVPVGATLAKIKKELF